jgi:hypothetical protein
MTIGFNSIELVSIFMSSLEHQWGLFTSRTEGASHGENPEAEKALNTITENARKLFPDIANPQILTVASAYLGANLFALMDTIVANNAEIEKFFQSQK